MKKVIDKDCLYAHKKITKLKDWLIIGALGWGLPFATILTFVFWKELTKPGFIIRLFFTAMGGGFCFGGLMFIFTWIYLKIKKQGGKITTLL